MRGAHILYSDSKSTYVLGSIGIALEQADSRKLDLRQPITRKSTAQKNLEFPVNRQQNMAIRPLFKNIFQVSSTSSCRRR